MDQPLTPEERAPRTTSWYVVGGILVVFALTRLLLSAFAGESPPAQPASASELPRMRLTEGRLSGQTAYAPYPTPPDRHQLSGLRLRQAPLSLHDRALYHLLANDLDRAISAMEEAARTDPGKPLLLSDLSALYGERARAKDRPEDYVAALEMAERAVAVGPDLPEAAFNRALALEHLFLYDKALDGWKHYLLVGDRRSLWSDEAREHSRRLRIEDRQSADQRDPLLGQRAAEGDRKAIAWLAAESPQEARDIFESNLLPKWAEAVARGQDAKASLRLTGARQIADTFAKRGKNRIFLKVVTEMEAVAGEPSDSRKISTLVQSLRRFRNGRDELDSSSIADAMRDLDAAERGLRSIGSAAELIVSRYKSYCQLQQVNLLGAHATLARLSQDPRLADYQSLEAWRQFYLSVLENNAEDLNGTLASSRRALDLFRALGEESNVAAMQKRVADILESLGQPAEAWRYRYPALASTRQLPVSRYALPSGIREEFSIALEVLEDAVQASLRQRWPEAALQLQSRVVSLTQTLEQPTNTALALLTRARIEAALGRQELAKRDFSRALNILPPGRNGVSDLLAARIDIARSEIADVEGRATALASESFIPKHLDQQADLDFRRGDTAAGEKSLERALDELERRRAKVTPGSYRVSFFDQARPLYERMVALEVHLAQPERALDVLERFRARALLDQTGSIPVGGVGATPLGWQDLRRRIPEHTVLAVYAVVEDRLVTWLVQRSGVWMAPHQADWPMVSSWAQRLRESQAGGMERKAILEQLYGELVAPWKIELDDGDRVIFVPTGELYSVPFAALIDRVSGRFLIEDHSVGVAPSASEFVTAVERDRRMSVRPLGNVLLVGDPVRSKDHQLPPLPGSAQEIESLSVLYRPLNARVLTRAQATPRRVLALLGEADIVHLAVHAVEDFKDPMRSRLLLSPLGRDPGELSVRDLLRVHLSRTRLVVLASCGSHAGPVSASEGSLSLAYSFLVAGVPAVVGSLWAVQDQSTARLSARFHQELLRGADALTALRVAQREEIAAHQSLSDWTWASFQVYGGVEERVP
jgi:CHAT domain-containing protein/tetratricopeptide (TPR) repeat protein